MAKKDTPKAPKPTKKVVDGKGEKGKFYQVGKRTIEAKKNVKIYSKQEVFEI